MNILRFGTKILGHYEATIKNEHLRPFKTAFYENITI